MTHLPGDILLTEVSGAVGRFITWGESTLGDKPVYEHRDGRRIRIDHAAIVCDPYGTIVEAMPGGARFGRVADYPDAIIARPPFSGYRAAVAAVAYLGVPYSFLDYLSIELHRQAPWFKPLEWYVHSTRHMICSQLVSQSWADGGHDLDPGRHPQDTTPAELFQAVRAYILPEFA